MAASQLKQGAVATEAVCTVTVVRPPRQELTVEQADTELQEAER